MLFDHDAEIGAFLLLNLDRKGSDNKPAPKIEGYLYRIDEIKETQDAERDGKQVKEEVLVKKDWYVMDCQGNWFNILESTNPFLHYLPYFIETGYAEDKAKLDFPIVRDWILNLLNESMPDSVSFNVRQYIPHENLTDEQTSSMTEEEMKAYYDKFRIQMQMLQISADWIGKAQDPETDEEKKDQKFDGKKKLLRMLDEFEYDIGDKK